MLWENTKENTSESFTTALLFVQPYGFGFGESVFK